MRHILTVKTSMHFVTLLHSYFISSIFFFFLHASVITLTASTCHSPSLQLSALSPPTHPPVNVEWGHNLREGEVLSDSSWHTDLVDGQVGIGSDDCTGGEVHPLPHEVTPHPALLALETLLD